jgi:hyperosmotically inducible protein
MGEKGVRKMSTIMELPRSLKSGMKMRMKLNVRLIVCFTSLWGGIALAQATPDQQASNTTMSTRHQFANPSAVDKALAKQVRRQLVRTKGVDASEVMVGVKDGAVLLRGRLDNSEQKERVESVVRAIPGVKSVDNQLTVQPIN